MGRTILIADDEISQIELYEDLFENEENFSIKTFYDGFHLLQYFHSLYDKYDNNIPLVILDVKMPIIDGFETAKEIRKVDNDMIIIMTTGYSDISRDMLKGELKQDIYYIHKPFNPLELYCLVNSLINVWEKNIKLMESEAKYRSIFESFQDIYYRTDMDGIIRLVSPSVINYLGYGPEELIGRQVKDIYLDPSQREIFIQKLVSHRKVNDFHIKIRHKDGHIRDVSLNSHIILDKKGKPDVIESVMRDITEKIAVEKELLDYRNHLEELVERRTLELKSMKDFLDNIINAIGEPIFVKDRNHRFILVNDALCEISGCSREEVMGKTDYDFFPEEQVKVFWEKDEEVFNTGKDNINEEEITSHDGNIRKIITKKKLYTDKSGEKFIVGLIRDVTEQKTYEEALMESEAKYKNLAEQTISTSHLASLGELAAGVAHEINNPINGIINYAQILVNSICEGTFEHEISREIIKEGERIADIVSSLLSFARMDKQEKISVSLGDVIFASLSLTGTLLNKDKIKVNIVFPDNLPRIMVQPNQIQQIFLNLLSNSRYALNKKYASSHENKIIKIRANEVSINNLPFVKISFYDYGCGIADNILDKIMNPFFTTKPPGQGTGLGLSISYGIISDHGGNISINSKEGEFTEVIITLPCNRGTFSME